MGVVNAYIADVTRPDERPDYLAHMSAANSLGIILGPAVGGLLARQGFSFACYVSAALSGFNLLACLALVSESRWQQATDVAPLHGEGDQTTGDAVGDGKGKGKGSGKGKSFAEEPVDGRPAKIPRGAGLLFAAGFLMIMGFASVESITGFFLMDTFFDGDQNLSAQFFGMCMVANGVAMFIFSGLMYRRLRTRLGENHLLVMGVCLRAGAFILQAMAPTKWIFGAGWTGVVLGTQCVIPSTSSKLTTMCPRSIYGRALGYQQSIQALARVVAPASFGWLYANADHKCSFFICAATTLLAGILILLVPLLRARQAVHREDVEANVAALDTDDLQHPEDVSPMNNRLAREISLEFSDDD